MLKTIIGLIGLSCVAVATVYTKPVAATSRSLSPTLTESSPGTYIANVSLASEYITLDGMLARVENTDIVIECLGRPTNKARIKYDGYKTSCRFIASL